MYHMIVEQTEEYPMRMKYDSATGKFTETGYRSLLYERGFKRPYGWIKESGTPPLPHWDCLLMADREFDLGDEVPVRVIGMFKRADGDHKYVAVEADRRVEDMEELTESEKAELKRLYPRVGKGEGWFGKNEAEFCMKHHEKAP